MKVVVVGASGFLGRHVVPALKAADHEVLGTSRAGGDGLVGFDLGSRLPDEILSFAPEMVVNLAWSGIPDFSSEVCRRNVLEQVSLIDEVLGLESVRRLVVSGTCREYGDAQGVAGPEACPADDFGRAKAEVLRHARDRCSENGVGLTWFRIFYVYGPGQRSGSLIPTVLGALGEGREPEIRDPSAAHDFVAASDVARAVVAAMNSTVEAEVLDVGSGRSATVGEVVDVASGLTSSVGMGRSVSGEHGLRADVARTTRAIGWRPEVGLVDGIRSMDIAGQGGAARLTTGEPADRGEPG